MPSLPRLRNPGALAACALAAALVVLATVHSVPAQAHLGKAKTTRIYADSLGGDTPTTWNAHLPKLASAHGWVYFVYTRDSTIGPAYAHRRAWVFERRAGTRRWMRTGRVLRNFLNMPGLLIDAAGRLHLVFTCEAGRTCTSDGANGNGVGTARLHDLVFSKRRRDGSFSLGAPAIDDSPDAGGSSDDACGYLGMGTDPVTGQTFGSLTVPSHLGLPCWRGNPDTDAERTVFGLGTSSTLRFVPQKVDTGTYSLYPELAISPAGVRYYAASEWIPGGSDLPYTGFGLSRWSDAGFGGVLFSDTVGNSGRAAIGSFASDMSFGPDGGLYLLYQRYGGPADCMSYLVRETAPASGTFSAPLAVGCHLEWAQLQVDSRGRIYVVEQSYPGSNGKPVPLPPTRRRGPKLLVSESDDGGASWTHRSYLLPRGPNGLPRGSTDTWQPTLVKPWGNPTAYDPDRLHGFVANWRRGPSCNWTERSTAKSRCSWSAAEFTIPIR
jgi:hypothetical protein